MSGTALAAADVLAETIDVLKVAAARLKTAEMVALGIPLDDPAALRSFVVAQYEDKRIFSAKRQNGKCGRPPQTPATLAVIVAALEQEDGTGPQRVQRQAVARRLKITPARVRDAPDNLRLALRKHDQHAGAEVYFERRAALVAAAARALADVEHEVTEQKARLQAERWRTRHAENCALLSSA